MNTREYNSLSEATRSLSQGPRQTFKLPATKTDPKPDLMCAAPLTDANL